MDGTRDEVTSETQERAPTRVHDLVAALMEPVIEVAWMKLGLRPDPATGAIAADLGEAKVAIDLAAHLGGILEPELDGEDRRQVQNVVRDLRLNYVSRAAAGTGGVL